MLPLRVRAVPTTIAITTCLAAGAGLIVALWGVVHWASRGRITTIEAVPTQPVALVLGAEVYADGTPSRYLRARLDLALELYRRGKVAAILVSGDGATRFYNETDGMRDYLIGHGIPAEAVTCDYAGLDTYDSCVRAKRVFGVDRAVVVTQRYHLSRAIATCRAIGLDAWGVGDETARANRRTWRHGSFRELGANLKLVWDLANRRRPMRGRPGPPGEPR